MRRGATGIAGAEQLQGKELSYNNLVDLDAAWQLIGEFDQPASAIIKHTNPCGCAEGRRWRKATAGRLRRTRFRRSAAVLAFNRAVDAETAAEIAKTFIEAIAAPGLLAGGMWISCARKKESAAVAGGCGDAGSGRQVDQRRISGPDPRRASSFARAETRGEDRARADRGRMDRARIRLEGVQAREVQRHRLRARDEGPDRRSASARAR